MTQRYKFLPHVYEGWYSPYYDAYKGHKFIIERQHPDDPTGLHVFLKCVTDENLVVEGCVHFDDLEETE